MKYLTLFFVLLCSVITQAQDSTLVLSNPIDISKDGWNTVLQLKNGNTMLFHFEMNRHTVVKVFDKAGKEIASRKVEFKNVDVTRLNQAYFVNLCEINNEAVLFISQDIDNLNTLMRLRFNSMTGSLIAEEKAIKSESFRKTTITCLIKKDDVENYAILTYTYTPVDSGASIKLIKFNNKHEVVNEVPFFIPVKREDELYLGSAQIDPCGDIVVTLVMSKIIQYGALNENTLILLYMPEGKDIFHISKMLIPDGLTISYAAFAKNTFADNINLFITMHQGERMKHFTMHQGGSVKHSVVSYIERYKRAMLIYSTDMSDAKIVTMKNERADDLIKQAGKKGSSEGSHYLAHSTNDRGVSTIVLENSDITLDVAQEWRYKDMYYSGKIYITQVDDNGTEIWATVIPKSNYLLRSETFPKVFGVTCREELYSSLCFNSQKSHYILFNDTESNFNKSLSDSLSDVYSYDTTNTVYYQIGKKNAITKRHFFNNTGTGVYNNIYPTSAHFMRQTQMLAVVSKQTAGKKSTIHIAWRKMED